MDRKGGNIDIDVDAIIDKLLAVRGSKPNK